MDESPKIEFRWSRSVDEATPLARLFSDHVSPAYISHSELQGPRAQMPTVWSSDIATILEQDVRSRINQPLDAAANQETRLAAVALVDDAFAGVFLVTFNRIAPIPFCIVEDMMIIPRHRNRGLGKAFFDWIETESRARDIHRVFLESGISNEAAHRLFESVGFHKISIVMMKQL
jgi:GNAT superfamily N-acetyltransferase